MIRDEETAILVAAMTQVAMESDIPMVEQALEEFMATVRLAHNDKVERICKQLRINGQLAEELIEVQRERNYLLHEVNRLRTLQPVVPVKQESATATAAKEQEAMFIEAIRRLNTSMPPSLAERLRSVFRFR